MFSRTIFGLIYKSLWYYIKAAKPEIAIPLYEKLILQLQIDLGKPIQTGEFGADMKVSLINDGPVTISIDSKNKE